MKLAIVIPMLNESATIEATLASLAPLRARGVRLIVVDGGSVDDSMQRAAPLSDTVLHAARGRAVQMNAGATAALDAGADALLFLHADTHLPAAADRLIEAALASARWGRFDVRIDPPTPLLRAVAVMMNWRSRVTGICTGDQSMFVRADLFAELGGFAPIALMEDIDWCRRARRVARPAALRSTVITSARRWRARGAFRTIALMWWLRLAFMFGVDPARLARIYRDAR